MKVTDLLYRDVYMKMLRTLHKIQAIIPLKICLQTLNYEHLLLSNGVSLATVLMRTVCVFPSPHAGLLVGRGKPSTQNHTARP